jgi:ATP-dependent Lon protease
MKSFNNEYYKQLTFVKHILNYPWPSVQDDIFFQSINSNAEKSTEYLIDIENKLTKLSYGHEEAKKALLQTIGKWISNPTSQGTSFGLVGPPGVGKTLLAKSVSKALNIPFAEITLGGQNDGEILHGHGYTYSGSQPGLIIKKMVEMGKPRCILYFDELDKACSKHGSINEITSILIHLTDPNMNKTFQDRFFQGVDFPLDKVIMIFSYNDANLVDPILLDRLKQIEVNAYTTNDKKKIVKEFIIPEIAESVGLKSEPWTNISDDLIEFIIENYTNEAGVRSIKRKIEQVFLTLNLDKIYKRAEFASGEFKEITKDVILRILDKPKHDNTIIHDKSSVGIINGLYATASGDGGIIPIQIFNNFAPVSYTHLRAHETG